MIPVLFQHDSEIVIGKVECEDHALIITFSDDFHITKKEFMNIVNGGFIILESYVRETVTYLKKVRVIELSYRL